LYVTWEKGAEYFEKVLLDADYFLNTGNWLWLSASAFFSQYFRVYSPVVFGKGFDKNGNYIRHFLPVLKDMPEQYIYEPWKAPLEVQRKANCIVGKDYPNRVVIHEEVSKTNMAKMKAAYDARKEGKSIKDVKEKPVSAVSKKRSQSPKTAPITKFFKKG
jgi:cryptochrome